MVLSIFLLIYFIGLLCSCGIFVGINNKTYNVILYSLLWPLVIISVLYQLFVEIFLKFYKKYNI